MKIKSNAHLRQTLEGLVKKERIKSSDVDQLLQSPDDLRAVLEREDAFDAPTQSAFDAVLGKDAGSAAAVDVKAGGFEAQNLASLMVNEKTGKGEPAWFNQCTATAPALFDVGPAEASVSVGSVAMNMQEVFDVLSNVGQDRSQWRGLPFVDVAALIRSIH